MPDAPAPTGNAAPTTGGGNGSAAPARPNSFRSHVANVQTETPAEVASATGQPANDNAVSPRPRRPVKPPVVPVAPDPMPEAPEMEAAPEPVAEDDGMPFDLAEAEIHGLKALDIFKAINEGRIPSELLDKLSHEWEVDGMKRKLGLHEVPKAIMRQADYSRAMAETKRIQAEAQNAHQQAVGYLQQQREQEDAWRKDPVGTFRRDLRRKGLGEVFVKAATAFAQEMRKIEQLHPDARAYAAREILQRESAEDVEWQKQQYETRVRSEEQQRAYTRQREQFTQQLREFVPAAFQRNGIPDNKHTQRIFASAWEGVWSPGQPITPQVVEDAAIATLQILQEEAALFAQQSAANDNAQPQQQPIAQPQGPQALSPRRMPGAAGAAPAKPTSKRPRDFSAWMKSQGFRK